MVESKRPAGAGLDCMFIPHSVYSQIVCCKCAAPAKIVSAKTAETIFTALPRQAE